MHVLGEGVEAFGFHGVVVLLLGGVDPFVFHPLGLVLGGEVRFGDGGDLTGRGQRDGLCCLGCLRVEPLVVQWIDAAGRRGWAAFDGAPATAAAAAAASAAACARISGFAAAEPPTKTREETGVAAEGGRVRAL